TTWTLCLASSRVTESARPAAASLASLASHPTPRAPRRSRPEQSARAQPLAVSHGGPSCTDEVTHAGLARSRARCPMRESGAGPTAGASRRFLIVDSRPSLADGWHPLGACLGPTMAHTAVLPARDRGRNAAS